MNHSSKTPGGSRPVLPGAPAAALNLHGPGGREPRPHPEVPGDGGRGRGRAGEDGRGQGQAQRARRQLRGGHREAAGADRQGGKNIEYFGGISIHN